jgi:hypothetical protein
MTASPRKPKPPNERLARLLRAHGVSRKSLAHRVNQIAGQAGMKTAYKHTSVGNWLAGAVPKPLVAQFVADALSERIGRPVDLDEIGMGAPTGGDSSGWLFPRGRHEAVRAVRAYWDSSNVEGRTHLTDGTFAIAGYAVPVTRWLAVPRDATAFHEGGRRVGRNDLADLWDAAEQARRWDSKFGGGSWHSRSVTRCLQHQAVPKLTGTYTEQVGKELFSVTAELSRIVAWSAFDSGHTDVAQRHFIQALRLARAGADVEMGGYVLTTMALHAMLEGCPDRAVDMAQGAYERAKGHATARVLAFAKVVWARAFGRLGDAAAASAELRDAEALLEKADSGTRDPDWLRYFTHARLAAAASEIFRDLGNPKASLAWHQEAEAISSKLFPRASGTHLAVVATTQLQVRDLDRALASGEQAAAVLTRLSSTLARRSLKDLATALAPWRTEPRVRDFTHRVRQELAASEPTPPP